MFTHEKFAYIENVIGYHFRQPTLLQQAFTRISYAHEHPGVQSNEVLELYGDTALSLAVMAKLSSYYRGSTNTGEFLSGKTEAQLSIMRSRLVRRSSLSACIERLGLQRFLLLGKGDILRNIQDTPSVQEDLFEAIVGAVALDSGWDMMAITAVVSSMLQLDRLLEEGVNDAEDEETLLQKWAQKQYAVLPEYMTEPTPDGFRGTVTLPDGTSFRGNGTSRREARMAAAAIAFQTLEEPGMSPHALFDPVAMQKAVGEPDPERSVNQLQELWQKEFITCQPEYEYTTRYAENGNPVWTCLCRVAEVAGDFRAEAPGKTAAKKAAAYKMLCFLFSREGKQ